MTQIFAASCRKKQRFWLMALALLWGATAWAQSDDIAPAIERTYPYSMELVQQGLQRIGGFGGGKLPSLDGFVTGPVGQVERYDRPYFQYRVHLKPVDANTTLVSVEAKITALYDTGTPDHSEYRGLTSNGRLESDLLDRLQEALRNPAAISSLPDSAEASRAVRPPASGSAKTSTPAKPAIGSPKSSGPSQRQLDDVLAERQAVRQKTAALQAQLDQLKTADHRPSNAARLGSVKHSGAGVMSRKNFGGPLLFRAQAEDEFEVVQLESGWAQVRLGPDSTGYIQTDDLVLPDGLKETSSSASAPTPEGTPAAVGPDLGFSVSREDVTIFGGDWARLKGKKVLFVYAQPRGLLSDLGSEDAKLNYAKRIFQSRFRTVSQSQTDVEGVVVVFMGSRGGVAAATLADIRQWVEGSLADEAFVNRCSLDPPAEFRRLRLN
jgi:hypothetical protein